MEPIQNQMLFQTGYFTTINKSHAEPYEMLRWQVESSFLTHTIADLRCLSKLMQPCVDHSVINSSDLFHAHFLWHYNNTTVSFHCSCQGQSNSCNQEKCHLKKAICIPRISNLASSSYFPIFLLILLAGSNGICRIKLLKSFIPQIKWYHSTCSQLRIGSSSPCLS